MATSVTTKFAGYLRGILGRAVDRALARPTAPPPAPVPPPAAAPINSRRPAVLPPPKNKKKSPPVLASAPAPAPAPVEAAEPAGADEIELPLAPVIASLPLELRAKLMSQLPAGQTIRLHADLVISQLAFGAVKISFGELRHLAPGVFVNSGGESDNKLISLPLHEILPRVNPALLARRPGKKVEVTEEIVGPFADRGRGFSFTTQPLKNSPAPAPAPKPAPAPAPAPAAPIAFTPPVAARHVAPPPPAKVPPPAAGNGHPLPVSPLSPPRSVKPTPPPAAGGNGHGGAALPPGLRLGGLNGNRAETPAPAPAPAPSPAPLRMSGTPPAAPAPAPARAASGQPVIFAALRDLCENWPDAVKNEVLETPLVQASVPLDGAAIVPGLKRGRVVMLWKQLRSLAQPGSSPSPNDNVELELPLKVIAPLFMAAQKGAAGRAQSKMSVSAEIPDLFFGFPQPAAEPAAPAPAPAPAPVPVSPIVPGVPPLPRPEQKTDDTNFYAWNEKGEASTEEDPVIRDAAQTDFMNRQAHPKDVVARAASLPGVAGAVVGMQDGLRVASQVSSDLNPDTLAAFLPQIFERVNQSTRELRMGTLNNISFTVGNVPWKIFRVNSVYFAIFGRPAEPLPSAQLAQLAAQLDRKKN